MKKIFTFLLFLPLFISGQTFFTTYGGTEYDSGWFITEDNTGNFIVGGDSSSDILLIKADPSGSIIWTKTYGDASIQVARCVRQTLDGGFILHGDRNGSESLLLKTNSAGDSLWSTYGLGGMGHRWGISVISLSDSSFVIGSVSDDIQSYNPYQILRVDKSGQSMWPDYTDVVLSTYFTGWGSSLIESYDHCYVTAGIEELNFQSQDVINITKVDTTGNVLWTKLYSASLNCDGVSLTQCVDSGFVIAGYSNSFSAGDYDMMVVKVNENGDSLWTKTYGGTGGDFLTAIQLTSDGGFVAFGYSNSYGNGYEAIILRLNSQGDSLWQKSFGGVGNEIVMHGIICNDGGFALTGSTKSFGAGNEDVFILKTDSSGNIINSVFEKEANTFTFYPNPFTDQLQFRNIKPFSHLTIYDIMSKVVFEIAGNVNELMINTDEWKQGVYLCRLLFSDGSFKTMKVVKV